MKAKKHIDNPNEWFFSSGYWFQFDARTRTYLRLDGFVIKRAQVALFGFDWMPDNG